MLYWNCGDWEINGLAIMCCAAQTALAITVWRRRLANARELAGTAGRAVSTAQPAQVGGKEAEGGQTPPLRGFL